MCEDCGCGITDDIRDQARGEETIRVMRDLMEHNDHQARHNREHFDAHGSLAINLMSSPGAGKTRLLEATAELFRERLQMTVIEGDLETENDAARLRKKGIPATQITTGTACHLDASMIHKALHELSLQNQDVVFIENVGNLVCPAAFDLGQHLNVVLLSVTEGDDKPAKYPVMFRAADLVLLTKCDLLYAMDDFDPKRARKSLQDLGMDVPVIEVSASKPGQLQAWSDWLHEAILARRKQPANASARHDHLHASIER